MSQATRDLVQCSRAKAGHVRAADKLPRTTILAHSPADDAAARQNKHTRSDDRLHSQDVALND